MDIMFWCYLYLCHSLSYYFFLFNMIARVFDVICFALVSHLEYRCGTVLLMECCYSRERHPKQTPARVIQIHG